VMLYGHCSTAELDELELSLQGGQKILALFCEFPGNPLLVSPDMKYIRRLADQYDFVVVCDDTVGTSVNCDLLAYVDVVVTSLTKMFSGECNVMGGS
jgi:cystathionine gamma-synthase